MILTGRTIREPNRAENDDSADYDFGTINSMAGGAHASIDTRNSSNQ
jgi:hypothetical protein